MAIFLHFKTTFYYECGNPSASHANSTYTFINLMRLSEGVFDVFLPQSSWKGYGFPL
jgi:hypothetical protein